MGKNKNLKMAGDLIYTVMATVVMNVALQIIIYPLTTRLFGDAVTGNILYFIGLIYIIPQAFGTTLNSARLVARKDSDVSNADFRGLIIISSAITALVCGAIGFADNKDILFSVAFGLFSVIYLLRVYAQVDFRLNLKFKEYFFYYCIISVGYLVGFGLFMLTEIWLFIFIVGEAAALTYSFIWGTIFKADKPTGNKRKINKIVAMILLSTLVRDCVNQFDKVILKQTMSANVVTQYHVVSLIAKTAQMLVQPINTLILSYLTVKDAVLSRKSLFKFTGISLGCGALFYGVCIAGTPVFVKLFYPDLYDTVMPYNYIVNLGLILGFVATLFMSVLLSQGRTAVHTAIQCVWGVCYIPSAYYFVSVYGLWGLAYVTLICNFIELVASVLCLFFTKNKTAKAD